MRVAFIHPDLGIGGAERLVVDAATGLQTLGHNVVIYTSFRDKNHCFDEARDGTLDVRVRGDWLFPQNILGRFSILCAILRQLHLAITFWIEGERFDAIFIDQLSVAIPLLKLLSSSQILFYCHFPDKLLSSRESLFKRLYRLPFDFVEEWSTGSADTIVVNSNFTASIFRQAFPRITLKPKVLYPCVDVHQQFVTKYIKLQTSQRMILSINRFEKKKNIELAIRAFALLKRSSNFSSSILVVAGGYDGRVAENVTYHLCLQGLCEELDLVSKTLKPPYNIPLQIEGTINVYFMLSIPGTLKSSLLCSASVLAYTPANEHFGIVPLEAQLAGLPVIAQDNGGPLETIVDGITGWLRPADPNKWSAIFRDVLSSSSDVECSRMGARGKKCVLDRFSQETMSATLERELLDLLQSKPSGINFTRLFIFFSVVVLIAWIGVRLTSKLLL